MIGYIGEIEPRNRRGRGVQATFWTHCRRQEPNGADRHCIRIRIIRIETTVEARERSFEVGKNRSWDGLKVRQ
jgi:hypothetical protein